MQVIPKLEIGTFKDRLVGYNEYRFICRLFISPDRDQVALAWLRGKGASILSTNFEKPYFKIIFATSNERIIRSIHHKYGAFKVDSELLYEEIDAYDEKSKKDLESFYSPDEYEDYHGSQFEYINDYSNAMAESSKEGWFYEELSCSEDEALKLALDELTLDENLY